MIYFDNAATTINKPQNVIDAMCFAMKNFGNSGRGTHSTTLDASRAVYETRKIISDFMGGYGPSQVVFSSNSTESLNIAINGICHRGDHIITTMLEHNSVLRPLYRLEESGIISLSIAKCDEKGVLDYEEIKSLIQDNTKAIVVNHISNVTGNITDIDYISKLCKENNICLVVDGSQSAGYIPINVKEMGIDVFCFTGHKSLMGPQGTGGLIVNPDIELDYFKVGGSGVQSYSKTHPSQMPTRLEAGTLNASGIYALGEAIKHIEKIGLEKIHSHENELSAHLIDKFKKINNVKMYGTLKDTSIVSFNVDGYSSGEIADILSNEYDIAIRPGAHCAPLMHKALGTSKIGVVRVSFANYNTIDEVNVLVDAIKQISK